jgi:hypothetical protein
MLGVHAVGGEGTDLDARALGVQQRVDALAGGHFALLVQLGDALFTAAFVDLVQALVEVGDRRVCCGPRSWRLRYRSFGAWCENRG